MRGNWDNPPPLSSQEPHQDQTDYRQELQRLLADLRAERELKQQAHRHLRVELRLLREDAERELQEALRNIKSRRGCQRYGARKPHKPHCEQDEEVNIKDGAHDTSLRPTGTADFCLGRSETCTKLKQLLLTLCEKINSGQAVHKLHHRQELELDKAVLFCHLLEPHGGLLTDRRRVAHSSCRLKRILHNRAEEDITNCFQRRPALTFSADASVHRSQITWHTAEKKKQPPTERSACAADHLVAALIEDTCPSSSLTTRHPQSSLHASWDQRLPRCSVSPGSEESPPPKCTHNNMEENGTDYGFLMRQNTELLRALDQLEKTCSTLRDENGLLRKSSAPETEEKVRRLRRKNTELAVLAKKLEERARKLQEANLKVVNSPSLMRPGSVEQYKRAFARQRARDLAQHADVLLSKDREIAALQRECRDLETQLGTTKGSPSPSGGVEFEKLLRESQREVLRLQRQLSVTSVTSRQLRSPNLHNTLAGNCSEIIKEESEEKVVEETPCVALDEVPSRCEETPTEEEESGLRVTPCEGLSSSLSNHQDCTEEQQLQFLESELGKKRKECENLEHEVKKRQRRCLDLESQLEDERGKNERLKEEAELLRRKVHLLDQTRAENEELREDLSEVTAQHKSVLEENQRLRAKLENLEQVLKHMREVAERRQQLELEHEQALAILKFKQDEIKRLQRAQLFAKREHEGVVQMLESKVRELEEKCRSQSEQFGMLSQELEKFRMQASKGDLASSTLLSNPSISALTNGVGLTSDQDVNAALRMGGSPQPGPLPRVERSPVTKHRELPAISVSKSVSSSSKSETTHLTPKSDTHLSPHKSSSTHEVDTASEVEELDIDAAPAPFTTCRGAAKLQVFIARYSYNPYDGPNDNPEVELPLTAGEYIYVYGDMDDDGFFEGELMDGRRGLVPSNFVERVSDDDIMSAHHPELGDISHNSLLDSILHSASHQPHLHTNISTSEKAEDSVASRPASAPSESPSALAVPAPLTNGLDLDLEEVGVDMVPYPRKISLIKQLAKSVIIGWDPPMVPAGWGNVWSYNVYVDQELRLNVPFGAQTKAVLERLDINLKTYRVSVQSLTEKGLSDQLRCSMLVGRDVSVAPTQLRVDRITATSANLSWLPSSSNYVHVVSLNEEECELVRAGCYSLCLNNLLPSLPYTVKVESRPHRTPWELPVERREHRSATITFTTLIAGPPDPPLDVQLEPGPFPGIALISWLPVTIDAVGTSNGVRVTGYTIHVDKNKVLEVSSPTAGSALLGPSQIHCLQGAQEVTVRTMSAHGESCDSLPVEIPSKLVAIMAGPARAAPAAQAAPYNPASLTNLPSSQSNEEYAAKVSTPAHNLPSNLHACSPKALYVNEIQSAPSYANAWANPTAAVAMSVHEAAVPASLPSTPLVKLTSPILSASPQPPPQVASPALASPPAPLPPPPTVTEVSEHSRDTDSPGTVRPVPSIAEFIDDPSATLNTPEPTRTTPEAPITDLLNPQDTHPLRPPSSSPLESDAEEERETTRLVSIDEFLRQDQEPAYNRRQQSFGLKESPTDYQADNSRSDLSDILEEEEEDLFYDHVSESQSRGYTVGPNRSRNSDPGDSDEDVLERILKLPPQVYDNKHLFSIAEVTEEEDSSLDEPVLLRGQTRPRPRHPLSRDSHVRDVEPLQPPLQNQPHHPNINPKPHSSINPHHHHGVRDPRTLIREPLARHEPLPKTQHRVRYADTADAMDYFEEDDTMHAQFHCPPQPSPQSRERPPIRGLGDRLRREAMLRSQMAVASAASRGHGPSAPTPYPVSKAARPVRLPPGREMEIDVEYGPDDSEVPVEDSPGQATVKQMRSEWWGEGAQTDQCRPKNRRGPNITAGQPQWGGQDTARGGQAELSANPTCSQTRQPKGATASAKTKAESNVRIFVALFPYDPVTMSPNPDAAEEELPFSEGQIIKVFGDKDADGFYRGESAGRSGYVPCNMVSEIQVEDEETRQQLLQQGFLSTAATMEKIGSRTHAQLPRRPVPPPKPRRSKKVESAALWEESVDSSCPGPQHPTAPSAGNPATGARRMVAIFDYDPRESSPNTDIEAELAFRAGDVIHVFGDMDEDGFFYGDLDRHRGLVPSNFLRAVPDEAPAVPPPAQPVSEPRKEAQESSTSSAEQQVLEPPAPQGASPPPSEPQRPQQTDQNDPQPNPAPTAESASAPAPAPPPPPDPAAAEACGAAAQTSAEGPAQMGGPAPADGPAQTDGPAQGKKKKSFFSKGKKLFKKFGSSKKE